MSPNEGGGMSPKVTIHLFLPTGKTFTFRNCDDVQGTENELTFTYEAVSDGELAFARFLKRALVGYSVKG